MHVCVHTCVYVCVCVRMCAYVCVCVCGCMATATFGGRHCVSSNTRHWVFRYREGVLPGFQKSCICRERVYVQFMFSLCLVYV